MTYDPTKEYQTKAGNEVMLLPELDCFGNIQGMYRDNGGAWNGASWDGETLKSHETISTDLDLVEKSKTHTVWVHTDFIEQAEKALEPIDRSSAWQGATEPRRAVEVRSLLRQAITEVRELEKAWVNAEAKIEDLKGQVRERDENLECAYSMLTEAKADMASLQAENANLLLRIEAENEADNEMHAIHKARIEALEGQVQVADMLANKLKAENAKLREDTQRGNEPHKDNTND